MAPFNKLVAAALVGLAAAAPYDLTTTHNSLVFSRAGVNSPASQADQAGSSVARRAIHDATTHGGAVGVVNPRDAATGTGACTRRGAGSTAAAILSGLTSSDPTRAAGAAKRLLASLCVENNADAASFATSLFTAMNAIQTPADAAQAASAVFATLKPASPAALVQAARGMLSALNAASANDQLATATAGLQAAFQASTNGASDAQAFITTLRNAGTEGVQVADGLAAVFSGSKGAPLNPPKTCPAYLPPKDQYITPNYRTQVSRALPDKVFGAKNEVFVTPNDIATLSSFVVPESWANGNCTLEFILPLADQLHSLTGQIADYNFSGNGDFTFTPSDLNACPGPDTTFNNLPAQGQFPSINLNIVPGNRYIINSGPCKYSIGQCVSGMMTSMNSYIRVTASEALCPIGLFLTYNDGNTSN